MFPLEPTLTISNLYDVLEGVKQLNKLTTYFDIPKSKQLEIEKRCSNFHQHKQAIIEEFIHNHPAPTWRLVAEFLYTVDLGNGKYHAALQSLKQKYLKGKAMF